MTEADRYQTITEFWTWFSSNQKHFKSLSKAENREDLIDLFQERLHRIDPEIGFEISNPMPDGSNELILTAEGDEEKFPLIHEIVAAAPHLPGWTVIPLKQPQGFDFTHQRGEIRMTPSEIFFLPMESATQPRLVGLQVGIRGYEDMDRSAAGTSLLIVLETGLGELQCAQRIRLVGIVELPQAPEEEGYILLTELQDYLDWRDRKNP